MDALIMTIPAIIGLLIPIVLIVVIVMAYKKHISRLDGIVKGLQEIKEALDRIQKK
jgi:Mn2+/Fe2+ NRAMP family transporter